MTTMLKFHPAADAFPLMEGRDFEALVADIREHGLNHPIVTHQSMILDGRNRWRACERAGVPIRTEEFAGEPQSAISFVVSENLHRRHLGEGARAMVAAKLATMKQGARTDLASN